MADAARRPGLSSGGVPGGLVSGLERLSAGVAAVERVACVLLVASFTLLLLANVSLRYLFNRPLYFAEELCIQIMIWMSFTATSLAIRGRDLVAVTLVFDAVRGRVRLAMEALIDMVVLGTLLVLLVASLTWIASPSVQYEVLISLGIDKRPFLAIMPIFFATGTLHSLAVMARRWLLGKSP